MTVASATEKQARAYAGAITRLRVAKQIVEKHPHLRRQESAKGTVYYCCPDCNRWRLESNVVTLAEIPCAEAGEE